MKLKLVYKKELTKMKAVTQESFHKKMLENLAIYFGQNPEEDLRIKKEKYQPVMTEVSIIPVKPIQGLVGFASFILNNSLYLGSIGIYTKPKGGFRITYPTKRNGINSLNIFYPINKEFGQHIEKVIVQKYENVMNKSNDRYNLTKNDPR